MAAYRKMDQKTLDREYSARGTVSDGVFEAAIANYTQLSEHCRQSLDCRVDIPYGSSPDEVLDIFPAGDNAPLFIFIHGGYWRALSQKESSFMAEAFTKRGVAVAAVNYSLAPEASLDKIVRQCRRALAWTYDNAKSFGVDRERIYIGGQDHRLYSLRASDGEQMWSYKTGGAIWSSPALVEDRVIFGSYDNHIYVLDAASGKLRGRTKLKGRCISTPIVVDGRIYVGTATGWFYCLG